MGNIKSSMWFTMLIYIAILSAVGISAGFISKWLGAYNPNAWGFGASAGLIGLLSLYAWGRQIWWFISGTGDFLGREGLLKRLWNKVFKK